jgi:hypothetical protein
MDQDSVNLLIGNEQNTMKNTNFLREGSIMMRDRNIKLNKFLLVTLNSEMKPFEMQEKIVNYIKNFEAADTEQIKRL